MKKFPDIQQLKYDDARTEIQTGDVLLASGNYFFSKLIREATGSCWSHVAFVMKLDILDRIMVLESIEGNGVRTIPLSEYISNFEGSKKGYKGRLCIARHDDFKSKANTQSLKQFAQFAIDRFAYPYDEDEIARITARIVGANLGFSPKLLARDEEYICSEYVYECYSRIGINVKQQNTGFIAPADFANDPKIRFLFEVI